MVFIVTLLQLQHLVVYIVTATAAGGLHCYSYSSWWFTLIKLQQLVVYIDKATAAGGLFTFFTPDELALELCHAV